MTLKTDLDTLAASIALKAALSDTSLQESVDALKALTQYYAVLQKGKKADDEDEDGTFADFAASIGEAANEGSGHGKAVRGRQQRTS